MTSQINPNNIDGTYPVAGQPNNTQGMRDNFTNTKTNFQYAADEINDLQNKSVLKSALAGSTLDNNMNDNLLYAVKLQDVSYTYVPLTATSGSVEIDYSAAGFQQVNLQGNISLNFTNWPTSGSAGSVRVGFNIVDTAHTVTLPAVVSQGLTGLQGVSPGTPGVSNTITFGAIGNYAFEFVTVDGGLTVWVFDNSRPTDVFSSPVSITASTVSTSSSTGALVVDGGVGINGNLYVGGTIVGSITVTGVNVTGNVTAGNMISSGAITSVGNIVGGNINTAGRVTATSNITGGNLNAVGLSLSGNVVSAFNVTGNITGGNVRSVGVVSAAGNITGGNIITLGALSTFGSIVNSSVTTTGNVSATGNVLGGNILTGGVVSATGNITTPASFAGNVAGLVTHSIRDAGNVTGTTLTLDVTSDDIVHCTFADAFTVSFANIIAGRVVTLIATNSSAGDTDIINTGISAVNMQGDATLTVTQQTTAVLTYYSLNTDTGNIFGSAVFS
jgi:hypothetical protein